MKTKDLAALAALAAGAYGLKQAKDVDSALGRMKYDKMAKDLGYPVDRNDFYAKRGWDKYAEGLAASDEELSAARRKAAYEELNPEGRKGPRRTPMVDRYGNPVSTSSGFAYTEGYKKGGAVKSASSRADGIAQRGKTKGKIIMCGGGMARGKK